MNARCGNSECQKKLQVPEQFAGRRIRCPACGKVTQLPPPELAVVLPADDPEPPAKRRPPRESYDLREEEARDSDRPRRRRERDDPNDDDDRDRPRRRKDKKDSRDPDEKPRRKARTQGEPNKKVTVIFWTAVIVIGVLVGGFFGIRYLARSKYLSPFQNNIATYMTEPRRGPIMAGRKAKRGMITINTSSRSIDHLYFDLPEHCRAQRPEDVTTIVWLQWGTKQVGTYTGGSAAYVQTCVVTVIDKQENLVIATTNLQGSESPPSVRLGSTGTGDKGTERIVNYLISVSGG